MWLRYFDHVQAVFRKKTQLRKDASLYGDNVARLL